MSAATSSLPLRQAYLEAFILVELLQAGRIAPSQAPSARAQLEAMLKSERYRLLSAGVQETWVDTVQMPIVALIDEAARSGGGGMLAAHWESLQFSLYGHEELGIRVFRQLEKLRQSPATPFEVLELYERCLSFGFQGEFAPDRLEALKLLRMELRHELSRRSEAPATLQLPFAAGPPGEPPAPMLRPLWIGLIGLLLLAAVGISLGTKLSGAAGQTEQVLRALTP